MAPPLSFHPASPADAEVLGSIMLRAMEPHLIDRFMVPSEDARAAYDEKMKWFLSGYQSTLDDPKRKLFKAVLAESGEVVGLGGVMFHDGVFPTLPGEGEGGGDEGGKTKPVEERLPAEKRDGFARFYFGKLAEIHGRHMNGVKHVVWTTLHVKPEYQGKGIGGAMLRWGYQEYQLEKVSVWLNTQMKGRNIYRRFGWEDADFLDVDLSEWGGKLRGFGVHRTPLMLRQPGAFKKIDGIVDE